MTTLSEREEALARMREQFPDDPQWANFDVEKKPDPVDSEPVDSPVDKKNGLFKAGSFELGLGALGGAAAGHYAGKMFTPYQPALEPNLARAHLDDLIKQKDALETGRETYSAKADSLRRQVDDLMEIQRMEAAALEEARRNYFAAQSPAAETASPRATITGDAHTRQIQGTGSAISDEGITGRSRLSGWRAMESELKEGRAAAEETLKDLQKSGLVKQGGISRQFPGITAASDYGVLLPAQVATDIEAEAAKIAAKNIPDALKIAELKDLYALHKSRATSASTASLSAEKALLGHINSAEEYMTPFQRSVQLAESRLNAAGGEKAALAASKIPLGAKLLSKIPGALSGAGAAMSGIEAAERSRQGDSIGATIAGIGAGLESLGASPHPIAKGVSLAGGVGSALALAGYDYARPKIEDIAERYFGYNSSVMKGM